MNTLRRTLSLCAILALPVAFAAPPPAEKTSYPQWFGDARNSSAVHSTVNPQGQIQGSIESHGVLICDETVFSVYYNHPRETLEAKEAQGMGTKWSMDLLSAGLYAHVSSSPNPMACATINGKPHFFAGGTWQGHGKLFCIRDDGMAPGIAWVKDLPNTNVRSWMKIAGDRLFVRLEDLSGNESILCLRLSDGSEIYRSAPPASGYFETAAPAADVARQRLYVASNYEVLVLDAAGQVSVLWTGAWIRSQPLVLSPDGSRLYIDGTGNQDVYPRSSMKCLDALTGALVWDLAGSGVDHALPMEINQVLSGNFVYTSYGDPVQGRYGLAAIDAATGGVVWKSHPSGLRPNTLTLTRNQVLWSLGKDGQTHRLRATDANNGMILNTRTLSASGAFRMSLPAAGNRIFPGAGSTTYWFE